MVSWEWGGGVRYIFEKEFGIFCFSGLGLFFWLGLSFIVVFIFNWFFSGLVFEGV